MSNKEKGNYGEFAADEDLDDLNSCSATDCTGVVTRAPQSDEELEAFKDIYDFEPPYVSAKSKKD